MLLTISVIQSAVIVLDSPLGIGLVRAFGLSIDPQRSVGDGWVFVV